jgi:hypothetical protein
VDDLVRVDSVEDELSGGGFAVPLNGRAELLAGDGGSTLDGSNVLAWQNLDHAPSFSVDRGPIDPVLLIRQIDGACASAPRQFFDLLLG